VKFRVLWNLTGFGRAKHLWSDPKLSTLFFTYSKTSIASKKTEKLPIELRLVGHGEPSSSVFLVATIGVRVGEATRQS